MSTKQRRYTYADFHNEDDDLLNIFHWNQMQVGTHDESRDETKPELPDTHGFCCPNGHGVCELIPMKHLNFVGFNQNDELVKAIYHKIYTPHCCPREADKPLVYEVTTENVIGTYREFLEQQGS